MTLVPYFAFLEYEFMVRAFIATAVLSLSIAPVGAFLVLRRLSLAGEAMAHAIVPGIVIAFVISGLSVVSMLIGGIVAGVIVALISTLLAKHFFGIGHFHTLSRRVCHTTEELFIWLYAWDW